MGNVSKGLTLFAALGLGACGLFAASDDELTGGSKPDASADGSGGESTGGTGGETGGTGGETGGTGGETGGTGGDTGGTGGDTGGTGGDTGGTGGDTGGTGGAAGAETGGTGGTGVMLKKFGELCSAAEPCEPQFLCLQPEGSAAARCATLCCGSADCASDAVCVPTKVSGTGCFPVAALNRPAPGSGVPNSACSGHGDCRSASCVVGVCKDACCGNAGCNGSACAWGGGTTPGWYCSTAAVGTSGGQGATCSGDDDCDGRNCFVYLLSMSEERRCMGPCCQDVDCGSNAFCDYYLDGAELIRQCFPNAMMPPGILSACCTNGDCPSGRCEVISEDVWQNSQFGFPVLGDSVPAMRCAP